MGDLHNRRMFLRAAAAAGAAWGLSDLAHVEDALAWAAQQVASIKNDRQRFSALTPDQAEVIVALTSRILPSVNGRPGARDAGVVYFIDRSLSTFNAAQKMLYSDGAKDLNSRTAQQWADATSFAALAVVQQDELLHDIETTPFFTAVRFDTVAGMFALPTWGGNRDYTGWHMLGMTHQARYEPPFGYYDDEVNNKRS
jgi:gluconate 2-dehydrogenase gamma chain